MMFKKSLAFLLASTLGMGAAQAATTLRLAHFWPAVSKVHTDVFEEWQQVIEAESGGKLKIEMYPGQTLSKADGTYQATVRGVTNIGATAQGYTNGRFPLSQIAELPGLGQTAVQTSCILQTLYDEGHVSSEYEDSHVLFMFSTGPGTLHNSVKPINVPKDLEGLRIRRPTAVAGEMLESMGAIPSGMPAPDIYTSLQRGVIDGLSFPWEGLKVFRINELTHYHTDIPFYSLVFVATMNKRDYQRLSPELKEVIDNNSGMKWSLKAGKVFDELDAEGKNEALESGHEIVTIKDPLNNPEWGPVLKQGTDNYLKIAGKNAQAVYDAAIEASKICVVK